jgi:hypothetical protein
MMTDSWCEAIIHNGKKLSGGAARNVRLAAIRGGAQGAVEFAYRSGYAKATDMFLRNLHSKKKK